MPDIGAIGPIGGSLGGPIAGITKAPIKIGEDSPAFSPTREPMGDFGAVLKDAVGALSELGAKADSNAVQLATGENVDLHEVMLSMEHASLGMQTALQVRNKLVDAYQEIMR